MYITINDIKGVKRIDLSYSIDSDKEIPAIIMLSDNIQYNILKLLSVMDPISDRKKMILSGTYASRQLLSMIEGIIELNQFEVDDQVTKTNKLKGITEITLNLDELDNSNNLKDGRPSNSLLTYYVTSNEDFMHFEPQNPQYKKLKNGEYTDIFLEYEITTQPNLARSIKSEYQHMALLYDRILRHRKIIVNKSDTVWNWALNTPCKSLTGILVLFEEEGSYTRDTSKFYNPKIQRLSVIVEGKPNQLYAQGMRSFEQYDKISKYFTEGKQRDNDANEIQKHLQLYDLSLGEYLVNNSALWLDFRTIDENELHRTGRHIENASEDITLQIEKKAESAGALNAYIYLIMDAQLNIQNGAYVSAVY